MQCIFLWSNIKPILSLKIKGIRETLKQSLKRYKIEMKKIIALAAALTITTAFYGLHAETVSQKQASRLAHAFFNQAAGKLTPAPGMVYNGRKLTTDRLFAPFYVYNTPSGGFVIISAENKAFPILGYSLKDNFNPDKLGDSEKALLSEYARDIEYIRHDSRVPEEAIMAWQNYPGYVDGILNATYVSTDPAYTMDEAKKLIEDLEDSPRVEELSSDMFTPAQWREMIDGEMRKNRSAVIGIISGEKLYPAIAYGKKGDYYRMELDGRNQWMMRLMASEFISAGQIADIADLPARPVPETEDPPFQTYDSFIAETRAEEDARLATLEDILHPSSPQLRAIGAGRYEITFPENVIMARVYNLQGVMIERYTYKETPVGHIDISAHPNGFYFALFNGESGKPYGFKLIR